MANRERLVDHLQALAAAERQSADRDHLAELETHMPDDPSKTALDRKLISLEEPHEVQWWTKALGLTEPELRLAVRNAGSNSVEKVREYLAQKK